ncbi:serine hydrolase [Agromyces mediolanus]|uniref:serine hydrolase n=1 Tax=Agromyces mediolanus TaxID=41986 RepID=UPI0038388116
MRRQASIGRSAALVAAITALTALTACTAPPPYAPRAALGEIPPQDAVELADGALDAALEQLPDEVERLLEESGVPGAAVAVVRGDELLFARGFGVRELGKDATVDEDTVFQIASMSKPIGATVVASQVGAGVVDWTTPVAPLLPGFALADPWVTEHLTVGDLYAHRSGLPMAAGDELEDLGYDRAYILDHLRYQPLQPFRISYNYANFGMTTGAQAVANAAGTDWETLSERELYAPLHMDSTSSRYADFLARDNRATLHARTGDGEFAPLYERKPDAQSPAGGVSSNVVDLAKWMSLLLGDGTFAGEELIAPSALAPAIAPEIATGVPPVPDARAGFYGYGFNVGTQPSGRVTLGHSGAFLLGAGTNFQLVPALDLGVVALTNGAPVGAAEAIVSEFLDRVQYGEPTRDWLEAYGQALGHSFEPQGDLAGEDRPATPAPPGPLAEYTGTWQNPYYGPAVVEAAADGSGGLVVRLGKDGATTLELEPWHGDVFAFDPGGENAPIGSRSSAAFVLGGADASGGDASSGAGGDTMTLNFYDTTGLGTWTR